MIACRFDHGETAVVRVSMDQGCICFPDDTEQALCFHHFMRSTPYGSMEVIEWLDDGWRVFYERLP